MVRASGNMAIGPKDVEHQKRVKETKRISNMVKTLEVYLDQMLLKGFTDILVDPEIDDAIQLDVRSILRNDKKVRDELRRVYRIAGWRVEYESDYRYISFRPK